MTVWQPVGYAIMAAGTGILFWQALGWYNDYREAHKKPRLKLEPSHLIWVGMIGSICSVLILGIGIVWQQNRFATQGHAAATSLPSPGPPSPGMNAEEAGRKIAVIDAALKLLREDVQPIVQAINSDLGWFGPRGGDDTVETRTKWLSGYYDKLSPAEARLSAGRQQIQQFAKKYRQWDDIVEAMSFPFPTDVDLDLREYVHTLQDLPQAAQTSPMDSLGGFTSGHRKLVSGKLSALVGEIDGAANKLLAIRRTSQPKGRPGTQRPSRWPRRLGRG